MNDKQLIQFINEQVRPLAEYLRDFSIKANITLKEWEKLSELCPDKSEEINDDRKKYGVSTLTGSDVNQFIEKITFIISNIDKTIEKPCVREPYQP